MTPERRPIVACRGCVEVMRSLTTVSENERETGR